MSASLLTQYTQTLPESEQLLTTFYSAVTTDILDNKELFPLLSNDVILIPFANAIGLLTKGPGYNKPQLIVD